MYPPSSIPGKSCRRATMNRQPDWKHGVNALLAAAVVLVASGLGRAADQSTFELIKTIQLKGKAGGLDHLALDAQHGRLFLANKTNNTLDVIDVKDGKM